MRNADRSTPWARRRGAPSTASSTSSPAARDRARRSSRSASPGWGASAGAVVVRAEEAQGAVHLGHRPAPEVGDPVGRLPDVLVAGRRAQRLRLHDDQAHVVRHHVVELLRDAHPLLGDGALGEQPLLPVQALGPLLQRRDARALAADVDPGAGGDRAHEGDGDDVAGVEARSPGECVGQRGRHHDAVGRDRRLPGAMGADRVERRPPAAARRAGRPARARPR